MLTAQELSDYVTRECFGREGNGKFTCNSFILFSKVYEHIEPFYREVAIRDLIEKIFKEAARIAASRYYESGALKSIEQSLNNCGGRWYELLFLDTALYYFGEVASATPQMMFYKLPSDNESRRLHSLLTAKGQERLTTLKLRTSNPDFIAVKVEDKPLFGQEISWKQVNGAERATFLLKQFNHTNFYGTFEIEEIIAILSVKLTTRPDRRYQHLHEANTIRAMFLNLEKMPPYIVATTEVKAEDRLVFASPTLLSVALPELEKQPSVNIFQIETLQDLKGLLSFISTVS